MSDSYPIGSTIWAELLVPSTAAVADFYHAVLGWTVRDIDDSSAVFVAADGAVVAGLRVSDEPPGWIAYLGGSDLAGDLSRAVDAGATVLEESFPLVVEGTGALLADPFGARFGIAVMPASSAVISSGALGRLSLVDPTNHDLDAQIMFQEKLFPTFTLDRLDHGINIFRDSDGFALRGAYEVPPAAREFVGPHWLAWFNVADQTIAVETALTAGGRVNTRDNVLSFGTWGVVVDPAGAEFKALQLDRPEL